MTALPRDRMRRTDRRWQFALLATLGGVVLAYSGLGGLGGLLGVGDQWVHHADYSHGFLVLPFAAYLLWRNRANSPDPVAWPNWAGLPLLLGPLPLYLAEADLNKAKEWGAGGVLPPEPVRGAGHVSPARRRPAPAPPWIRSPASCASPRWGSSSTSCG